MTERTAKLLRPDFAFYLEYETAETIGKAVWQARRGGNESGEVGRYRHGELHLAGWDKHEVLTSRSCSGG